MFEIIKHGISAIEKLADAMIKYAAAISEHADAVANRKQSEKKPQPKDKKVRNFQVVCIETGEMITSRAKYALYRKIKIGLGGTSTKALKQGKTVKSAKTQLHYKAVKGFE